DDVVGLAVRADRCRSSGHPVDGPRLFARRFDGVEWIAQQCFFHLVPPANQQLPRTDDSGAIAPASSPEFPGLWIVAFRSRGAPHCSSRHPDCRFYGLAPCELLFHNRLSYTPRGQAMKIDDVRRTAYSMPLTNPAFPMGPYR